MVEARPAATVILLRDSPQGPELLLLLRSGRVGFFPHAWVFPGGRIDPTDAALPATGEVSGLAAQGEFAEVGAVAARAAVRECFEESGVWLGSGSPPEGLRAALNAQAGALHDAPDLVADLSQLALWARWVTPVLESRRYDTWFFLATVPSDAVASPDTGETISHLWIRPQDALDRLDELPVAPPTFRTLEELAGFSSAAAAMEAAAARVVRPVCPRLDQREDDGSWEIVLPGDASYPSDTPVEGPTRIGFRQGRWWSHR